MLKNMEKILVIVLTGVVASGCASARTAPGAQARRVETRFYAEDRPRLDQDMTGNFGYIMGTPKPEDRSQYRTTRRVYVLEVIQNVEEALHMEEVKIEPYVPSPSRPLPPRRDPVYSQTESPLVLPALDRVQPAARDSFEEYVIQDGDTLQKISKKFYGSYAQWMRIYDANKDVLSDPNRIRAGIRIRIPAYQGDSAPVQNLK